MVYATYARRWYQDPVNFIKAAQQRLVFDPAFVESIPEKTVKVPETKGKEFGSGAAASMAALLRRFVS